MVLGQLHDFGLHPGFMQLPGQVRSRALACSIYIRIKGDEGQPVGIVAQLGKLPVCQAATESAGCITKTGLPEDRQIEKTLHENNGGSFLNRFPRKQAALGTRQEAMRWRRADAAPVQIDDAVLLETRKDDAVKKAVTPFLRSSPI